MPLVILGYHPLDEWQVCVGALTQPAFQMKPFDWYPEPTITPFGSFMQAHQLMVMLGLPSHPPIILGIQCLVG
jgi:hypothetical protein